MNAGLAFEGLSQRTPKDIGGMTMNPNMLEALQSVILRWVQDGTLDKHWHVVEKWIQMFGS